MSLWRISRQVWGRFRQQTPLRRLGWQLGRVAPWSPARNSAHCQSVNREICFSIKTYGSNFIKQHSETVMVWNYQNADCSLRKKLFVSFIIILGTLSFLIIFRQLATLMSKETINQEEPWHSTRWRCTSEPPGEYDWVRDVNAVLRQTTLITYYYADRICGKRIKTIPCPSVHPSVSGTHVVDVLSSGICAAV